MLHPLHTLWLCLVPAFILLIALRGKNPPPPDYQEDILDYDGFRNYLVELACTRKGRQWSGISLSKIRRALGNHRTAIDNIESTIGNTLTCVRSEVNHQRAIFYKYIGLPKNGLWALLSATIVHHRGSIDIRTLSDAVNIYAAERPLTKREISLIRDTLGLALLWYLSLSLNKSTDNDTRCAIEAILSLSALDDWLCTHNYNPNIYNSFLPVNQLTKYPSVIALRNAGNPLLISDRGRDFCDIIVAYQSVFDYDTLAAAPYAMRYNKLNGAVSAVTTCTIDPLTGFGLLHVTLTSRSPRAHIIPIEITSLNPSIQSIHIKAGEYIRTIGTGGKFRLWVKGSISLEVFCVPNSWGTKPFYADYERSNSFAASLIHASIHDFGCVESNTLLSRISLSDTSAGSVLNLYIKGTSGISWLEQYAQKIKSAQAVRPFAITLIYHQRASGLIDYHKCITDICNNSGISDYCLHNNAVAPFDGIMSNTAEPNPITKLLSDSIPYTLPSMPLTTDVFAIDTPDNELNSTLYKNIHYCLEQIFLSTSIAGGTKGLICCCYALLYTDTNKLNQIIQLLSKLQDEGGFFYNDAAPYLASLIAELSQRDTAIINQVVDYNSGASGTLLEHALRAIEYCHYNDLATPLTYDTLGLLIRYAKDTPTIRRLRGIMTDKKISAADNTAHPGLSIHLFVKKVLGISYTGANLRIVPTPPDSWNTCNTTICGTQIKLSNRQRTAISILKDGKEYLTDTITITDPPKSIVVNY